MISSIAQYWIDKLVDGSPVGKALSLSVEGAAIDRVTLAMPISHDIMTTPGVMHGGMLATLIDTAGAAASASGVIEEDKVTGGATTHLSVAYFVPARTDVVAIAAVVHRSRTSTMTDVAVSDSDGRLVARGQVTSRIFH
ncbi:PaaI family thioesterase [Rhodococcus sp. H29-C3]|uniref:PaaI family thioesterase n=1 Tax=Rhodococcus sp. H29-C3 TaxID=3046307 RepID=UPI0024BB466D|nr:PaaI family thioesterase [Rhodococcus sp. H29-C3]MDJ0362783.1 PaaI family thioesterase [Rhodococcus sp. H29-C3]